MLDTMTFPAQFAAVEAGGGRSPQQPMNETQFDAFYRKTAGNLWAYIYRLTGDPATADDLLQKAFFRFLRSNPPVESEEHMRRYIFRTATNLALDHFRENKRERGRSEEPLLTTLDVASPRGDGGDLRQDMARMFSQLKPRERALLWLAHVEEADHEEISAALGLRPKSVRVLLFRARKRLGDILRKNGFGPGAGR
jgi:RNA polymerase sigma-70 factor (ECF subfamily)